MEAKIDVEPMQLKQQLSGNFPSKLNIIEQEAEKIWKKGEFYHVYYTLHGLDHSNYVIQILEKLIDGLNPEDKLNETEIFCLLSAAYLHDVGMLCKYPDDDAKATQKSELKKRPYSVQDLIRDEHHIRSGRYIKEHREDLKLDHIEAECVRLIAEGHRQIKLESKEYDDQVIGQTSVRVRLLSALLRLADELDITYGRAPETLYDLLENDMPDYSRLQWLKHYYTAGVLIDTITEAKGKKRTSIVIHCQYPKEDVGRKITEVLISTPVEETLNEVRYILLDSGLRLNLDYKIKTNQDLKEIPEHIYDKYLGQKLKISMELPRTKGFVGRNTELNDLLSSLDKNVIIIEGIAGIGKSYIAAKFAEELKDEYTIYWYGNLSEVSTLSSVMNKISIFLKENDKPKLSNSIEHFGYDNEVLIALVKEELNSNNFALFFDDYHKAEKELNPLLKQLVSITSSKIIIVTREEPEFYNVVDERENRVTKIKVDAWDFANTKMMLETRGIEATEGTIQEIHDRLLGHPQYLNLFCILAERSSAENLLENLPIVLRDAREYLEKEVYNSLTAEEKRLLQTIAVFRVSETVDAFDNVNKFEFKDLNETLNSLIHKFLVNEIGIDTYSVHEIIRDYSLNDVRKRKILRNYHELAAQYYLSLDNDPEHVLEASYHFNKAGMKEEAAKVIIDNAGDLIAQGFWEKIEDRLQSAIKSFRRKTQLHIIQLVARANLEIGRLYVEKDDYDLALRHATKCLMPFNKIHDTSDIYDLYTLLGSIYLHKNDNANAKEYNEKCLHMAEKQKDEYLKAVAIANRGTYTEDVNENLNNYLKSLKIFENENKEINIADACTNIATVYAKMKNYEKSYEFIKRALKLKKERNAVYDIANTKLIIADIYYDDPKKPVSVDSIINCLKEALETYEKIGHVRGTARVLTEIGDIHLKEEDFESAITNYQRAVTIYSSVNQQSEEAKLNTKIGLCYVKLKDSPNAKSYFEKNLLSGHCDIGDKLSLAEIYLNIGEYNEALDLSNKLITDTSEEILDDKRYVALLFSSISSVLLNNVDDVYNYLKKIGEFDSQKYSINPTFRTF